MGVFGEGHSALWQKRGVLSKAKFASGAAGKHERLRRGYLVVVFLLPK